MSVAFMKEESAEAASETLLPDRPISPHPNLITQAGLTALEAQLAAARTAYEAANTIEDVNERRRQSAGPLRDLRYLAERVRTAQVMSDPASSETVAFGNTVTFSRDDGRVQTYRIVGEDYINHNPDCKKQAIRHIKHHGANSLLALRGEIFVVVHPEEA